MRFSIEECFTPQQPVVSIDEEHSIKQVSRVARFDSIEEVLHGDVHPRCKNVYKLNIISGRPNNAEWWGWYGGYEKLQELIETGWVEGYELMAQYKEELTAELAQNYSSKRVTEFSDFGNEIDVHKMMAGNLDRAWRSTRRVRSHTRGTKYVTIVLVVSTSCDVRAEAAFWRGATATLLVDQLQATGFNVRLIVTESSSDCVRAGDAQPHDYDKRVPRQPARGMATSLITVKDYSDPADMEYIAVASSIGFFRGIMFKAKMFYPGTTSIRENLGYPEYLVPCDMGDDSMVVVIPNNILSKQAAIGYMQSIAAGLNEENSNG